MDEAARLREIERYECAGAMTGPRLRQILELAQLTFDVRDVNISTIYADRQLCHSRLGELDGDLPRDESFCHRTIESDDPLVVPDARSDPRFRDFRVVREGPEIRFYAGAPLITPDGYRLGSLCLIGDKPRAFGAKDTTILRNLAALAMEHMELVRLIEAGKFDELTGLRNRRFLIEAMETSIASGRGSTTLLIDLDGFKAINDSLGHAYGDEALREVAARLARFVGEDRVVARLGGDEFVVFLDGIVDLFAGTEIAQRIVAELGEPISMCGHLVHLGASIGIVGRSNEPDAMRLLGNADLAMYRAKAAGRNCYRVFTRDIRSTAIERGNVILELQEAWEDGALELYYQPVVRLSDGAWIGAEALLRWNYPYRGVLAPAVFLPVLEESHLALPVGTWIIQDACRQAAEWRRLCEPDFKISVNLFEVRFKPGDLVEIVIAALAANGLPPAALELEITERVILAEDRRILNQIKLLKDMGVGIAFDDFGTGFASLSALKDYPVTCLKIDRSFIAQITKSEKDLSIVDALLSISRAFDLDIIAEGVETIEQHDVIRNRLCPNAQGYLFGRPVTARAFETGWQARAVEVSRNEPALMARSA